MKECIQQYFIKNGQVLDCQSFHQELIDQGKSIYEVLRFSENKFLFAKEHIDRLFSSMQMERIESWKGREEILESLENLVRINHSPEGNIKIVMNLREGKDGTFLAYFVKHRYPFPNDYKKGVPTITFPFERQDPNKKLWRPEFRHQVRTALQKTGAFEALLLDSEDCLPEASKSNIFALKKGEIITSPDRLVLPGITRKFVLEACRELGLPVQMRKIRKDELEELGGLFLTGTSLKVLPVSSVDRLKLPVNNVNTLQIMKQFDKIIQDQYR